MEPTIETGKEITLPAPVQSETRQLGRYSRGKIAVAFGVAAVSDLLSISMTFLPPVQLAIDLATAAALFWVLGKRWALLPGFVAEAIPGMGVFPWWVLVVLSILLYDGFKKRA